MKHFDLENYDLQLNYMRIKKREFHFNNTRESGSNQLVSLRTSLYSIHTTSNIRVRYLPLSKLV